MAEIQGTCDERLSRGPGRPRRQLRRRADVGASVAVILDGELVVDIWGGCRREPDQPWERDTITNVWSTTKTMTELSALILADQGDIDFHAPVAPTGPSSRPAARRIGRGPPPPRPHRRPAGWAEPLTIETSTTGRKPPSLLAAQEPWWEPGTASGYHAVTQGYLVGEVVRRVTGQTLGRFFPEVAGPLGADFHIGLDAAEDDRVAQRHPAAPLRGNELGSPERRGAHAGNPLLDGPSGVDGAWRRAEIPAANGHGNARSVARSSR